ncbi:DUF6220 domain-containing protein [Microbacterium sp. SD291]|uniref:DUF6220 domain-containing protein n=1 Tax=Microbacterium sp. SD291 TaxID=2782007 RepID=UPI001A97945B|nr:DUF6220 domain-containing protein [Microbacterium sp. SD291]MBO0981658.1 hypothetical protein [Microbacterium sp. SD291]
MRKVFFVNSILVLAGIATQYYLAAVGVFSHSEDGFTPHGNNGRMILPILFILLIVFAAVSRAGKRIVWLSVLMLGLLIIQTLIFILTGLIFGIGPETVNPPIASVLTVSLHAVNPLIMIGVGLVIARHARRRAFPSVPETPSRADAAAVDVTH